MTSLRSTLATAFGIALVSSILLAPPAEARRGGSFGSRGSRTYYAPHPTPTAPRYAAPVQRSMTSRPAEAPRPGTYAPAPVPGQGRGLFGGFGGGLMGGLLAGGLIGGMLGHGWGGGFGGGAGGGLLTILIQLAVLGGIIWLVMRFFRSRSQVADRPWEGQPAYGSPSATFGSQGFGGQPPAPYVPATGPSEEASSEFAVTSQDRDAFERLLREVQDAFGREDYSALRERTTPEIMSYLAEELSQNATQGRRNEVTGTRLLQADVSEAWREGDADYATVALRYESTDIMRDRNSGAVLSGDASKPSETTELWTFVRQSGGPWKLSAIQET